MAVHEALLPRSLWPGGQGVTLSVLCQRALICVGLLLVAAIACGPGYSSEFDFVANLDLATFHPETRIINVGLPTARRSLRSGWSYDEKWAGDWAFAWGLWPESTLEFYTFEPRSTVIRFRCSPSDKLSDPSVEVLVNGQEIGVVALRRGFQNYHVRVPSERLRVGRNEIRFRYRHSGDSFPVNHGTARQGLAVAWQRIRMGREFAYGSVAGDSGSLELPFHTRVDYFLDVPPNGSLRWERALPSGMGPGQAIPTLRVEVLHQGDAAPEALANLTGPDLAAPFIAPLDTPGWARVSFLALPGPGTPERASGVRLVKPALMVRGRRNSVPMEDSALAGLSKANDDGSYTSSGVPADLPPKLQAALDRSLPTEQSPNIIVYLVDTLRADHLGTYGYDRPTSPFLDAMGSEGVVFDHAMAQSGWTRTSVASILTGLQPRVHAVLDRDDALSDEAITLPRLLREQNYETHAVVTNGNVGPSFGFRNGFDSFAYVPERVETEGIHQSSERVNEVFFDWLGQRNVDKPFFAYLHTTDPHGPYTPSEPYRSRFLRDVRLAKLVRARTIPLIIEEIPELSVTDAVGGLVDLYDAEIAYNDYHFGQLLDHLRALDLYDSTLVLFVSDHGEEFFEHGAFEHGKTLYSEMIFVPLVIKFPGGWAAGTRVSSRVQHIDIMPTILQLAGLPPPPGSSGDSLVAAISGAQEGTEEEVFLERSLLAHLDLDRFKIDSLLTSNYHLIVGGRNNVCSYCPPEVFGAAPTVDGRAQLFSWRADRHEELDVSGQAPVSAGYLRLVLQGLAASQLPLLDSEDTVISGELARRLRALGYIQ